MIIILHGGDTQTSRNEFLTLVKKQNGTILPGESFSETDAMQIFEGGGLFTEEPSLFLEDFLTRRKPSRDFDAIIKILLSKHNNASIVLWESKELPKSKLTPFKEAQVKLFKLPQALFQFLDSLHPNNTQVLLKLFHEILKSNEPELIFFLMIRQFRLLLALIEDSLDQIDEVQRMSPWQIKKLLSQSRQFSVKQLKQSYSKLFTLDVKQKTGQLGMPLPSAIDIFLLDL